MACAGCMGKTTIRRTPVLDSRKPSTTGVVVEKSDNPNAKVRLRYYGGGSKKSTGTGCSTCHGGKGGYVVTSTETIQFVSEDVDSGLFKMTFSIGHDYYVTEKQAEYLLTLTYRNRAGQVVNKFERVED